MPRDPRRDSRETRAGAGGRVRFFSGRLSSDFRSVYLHARPLEGLVPRLQLHVVHCTKSVQLCGIVQALLIPHWGRTAGAIAHRLISTRPRSTRPWHAPLAACSLLSCMLCRPTTCTSPANRGVVSVLTPQTRRKRPKQRATLLGTGDSPSSVRMGLTTALRTESITRRLCFTHLIVALAVGLWRRGGGGAAIHQVDLSRPHCDPRGRVRSQVKMAFSRPCR